MAPHNNSILSSIASAVGSTASSTKKLFYSTSSLTLATDISDTNSSKSPQSQSSSLSNTSDDDDDDDDNDNDNDNNNNNNNNNNEREEEENEIRQLLKKEVKVNEELFHKMKIEGNVDDSLIDIEINNKNHNVDNDNVNNENDKFNNNDDNNNNVNNNNNSDNYNIEINKFFEYPKQLIELQKQFPNINELELKRFLNEHKGSVKTSVIKLNETLKWRQEYLPITREEVMASVMKCKFICGGFDRQNHLIAIFRCSHHVTKHFKPEETVKYLVHEMERMISYSDKLQWEKYGPTDVTLIVDRTDQTVQHVDIAFVRLFYQIWSKYYPSRMAKLIIWKINPLFQIFWPVFLSFLGPRVKNKVVLCDKYEELLQHIDEDNIYDWMGGKKKLDFDYHAPPQAYYDAIKRLQDRNILPLDYKPDE